MAVTLFFSLVVFKPVHDAFPEPTRKNDTSHESDFQILRLSRFNQEALDALKKKSRYMHVPTDYLWMYLIFAYLLSGLIIYLLVTETERIIGIRQQFLGSQHTVADRTIRLSGIPSSLRSEKSIKDYIERLDIGKVDSVSLCHGWQELDDCVEQRMNVLRKLEEAWTVYLGSRRVERNLESLPVSQPAPPGPGRYTDDEDEDENERLIGQPEDSDTRAPYNRTRPQATIRFGYLKLRSKTVDAIDYYEEVLKGLDERISHLREKEFIPTPLAFVTMDSVAACVRACRHRMRVHD